MKKFFATFLLTAILIFSTADCFAFLPKINYQAYVQNEGWLKSVENGGVAGTTGRALRLEAILINLNDLGKSMIQYSAHVQNIGWQKWQNSGGVAGTVEKNLRMEAIKIKLVKPYDEKYDIYYRAHVQKGGWLGLAKNGEPAGTAGASVRMEALQIFLVPKGSKVENNNGKRPFYQKTVSAPKV